MNNAKDISVGNPTSDHNETVTIKDITWNSNDDRLESSYPTQAVNQFAGYHLNWPLSLHSGSGGGCSGPSHSPYRRWSPGKEPVVLGKHL